MTQDENYPIEARAAILREAERLVCRDRQDQHGNVEDSFRAIARYWSTFLSELLGQEVALTREEVGRMMALLKLARMHANSTNKDSWVDAIGYLSIGYELLGPKSE